MINFRLLCCAISFFIVSTLSYSQQKHVLSQVYTTNEVITIAPPLLIDSTNIKGDKFDNKSLLESSLSTNIKLDEKLNSGLGSYFYMQKAQKDGRFHLLSFDLTSDRYTKVKIKVSSPGMFELYVNDKKEVSKTSIEDSIMTSKSVEATITTNPRTNKVLIKYLSLASNVAPECVKIEVEALDSLAELSFKSAERRILINDIMEGKRVTSTSISPDGRFVQINYKTVLKGGKVSYSTELYDVKTKIRRDSPLSSRILGWTPISSRLYYTEDDDNGRNLLAINTETMISETLASGIPTGTFYFTPDEKNLIFIEKESAPERKGDLKLLGSMEDRQSGFDDRYLLSSYSLKTGVKQRLTYGKSSTNINDISPDSRYLLFSVFEEALTQRPFRKCSMFQLDLQTLAVDTIWKDEKFSYSAKYSPDGKMLLIEGSGESFGGIGQDIKEGQTANSYNGLVFLMDLKTKSIKAITKDFKPSVNSAKWSFVDNKIYLATVDRDCEHIYTYDLKTEKLELLPLSEDVVKGISLPDKTTLASYYGLSALNSTKAYVVDLSSKKSTLISDPLADRFADIKMGEMKDWNFVSSDGTTIEGRYYLPPNFDASKKYPMIVYYYGGTTPTARTLDHPYSMPVYAAMGYVVYVVQPSGTIGYGQEFAARHVNAWGIRTAEDIIEGTKEFIATHNFVDASKVGCIGASYGGFMTMYLQTRTDIFAAAVSHAGISALSSYWGEGYWGYTYSSGASANSYPWNNKELYVEQSPLFNADKINTPLLLLHGMEDTNVPIGESIQMYTALKILGKPVEFIQVKGENHGIMNYDRRLAWNYSIYAWFAKWLKDDSSWWNSLYKVETKN